MNHVNSLSDSAVQEYIERHGCDPELLAVFDVDFEYDCTYHMTQPEVFDAHVEAYAEHCLNTPVTINSDTVPFH